MAVDIQKLFNEDLTAGIAKNQDQAKAIGNKFQINVTGEGGGKWFVDCTAPKVEAGEPGGAECTVEITTEDFQKLMENPQANGMQLFFAGKLKVTGNQMLGMKLQALFALNK
ncbi:MAG: SCP2 sterol-binding domain-containing protein [Myxococcales bacterium]|nr:SCP2 sterol-binding domain-containing protein [Myxococcales bacterium]MCC6522613.1 SCP2 sterol-binding domain-containing protein [Polyangiaceae bacterium]